MCNFLLDSCFKCLFSNKIGAKSGEWPSINLNAAPTQASAPKSPSNVSPVKSSPRASSTNTSMNQSAVGYTSPSAGSINNGNKPASNVSSPTKAPSITKSPSPVAKAVTDESDIDIDGLDLNDLGGHVDDLNLDDDEELNNLLK